MNTLIKQSEQGGYRVTEIDIVDEEKIAELENSKLVYNPKFIPFYPNIMKDYELSYVEAILYGFIDFYLGTSPTAKFYFTNDQLSQMLDVSPSTVSNSISKLVKLGLFQQELKVKANGGTFRLLKTSELDSEKLKSLTLKNFRANNNKINNNTINISKDMERSSYGNQDITRFIKGINKYLPLKLPEDKNSRRFAKNALDLLTKLSKNGEVKEGREFMSEDKWENAKRFLAEYDAVKLKKGYYPQSWQKLNDNIKIWISNEGSLEAK